MRVKVKCVSQKKPTQSEKIAYHNELIDLCDTFTKRNDMLMQRLAHYRKLVSYAEQFCAMQCGTQTAQIIFSEIHDYEKTFEKE